ncbi:MAG TPA: hypothetical protein VKQ52_19695 [Puia sp.]|nr:hypothetical protein [Puia sp.]
MKKGINAFKKTAKHKRRKAKTQGDVVSHRSKKDLPRSHPYSEADLSPSR